MSDDRTHARRLLVEGRVQGVGFRAWLEDEARAHGLDGWVRNRRDGTVEAVLAGAPARVDAVVQRCHAGPALARVSAVRTTPVDEPVEPGFRQRSTV